MASLVNILDKASQQKQEGNAELEELDDIELDFEDFGASSSTVDNALFNFGSASNLKAGQNTINKDTKKAQVIKDDFDDEFDYEEDDQSAVQSKVSVAQTKIEPQKVKEDPTILQEYLKKIAISKEKVRKKNYIGDAVIAERSEQEEVEVEPGQQIGSIDGGGQQAANYMKRYGKIAQLYDESTKEYKNQQKEIGIKKAEDAILRKAKEEIKKIESYKQKFRQSAFGGVITNQLAQSIERIKENHSFKEPENKQKYEVLKEEEGFDSVKESQREVQIEVEFADSANHNQAQKSKKKKKKKKIVEVKQNSIQEPDESEAIIDEVKSLPLMRQEISKDQNLTNDRLIEEVQVDWDQLNQKNARQALKGQNEEEEEDKLDIERRSREITYEQAINYFQNEVDLSKELQQIAAVKEDFRNLGFLQRLTQCFMSPKLSDDLSPERDLMFALTRIKLDTSISEHEVIIKTIYKKLTGLKQCRLIGSHWGDIGFQGNDPKTDVRGAGMLGLLHILFFIDKYHETAKSILHYSNKDKVEFPMAVRMFEFSVLVISLMREGRLYNLCNDNRDVMETVGYIYTSLFLHFVCTYIENKMNITHMNELNILIERAAKSNLRQTIAPYFQVKDLDALRLLKQAQKKQSQIDQDRLRKLAQMSEREPQFQISQSKPDTKKIPQQNQSRKASSYASAGEPISKAREQPQRARQGNSEFSAL